MGAGAHLRRVAARVHHDHAAAPLGSEGRHRRIVFEAADVVDPVGAGVEASLGHARAARIDRERQTQRAQGCDRGEQAAQLLRSGDLDGAGSRALRAEIERGGSLCAQRRGSEQERRLVERAAGGEQGPAIGE